MQIETSTSVHATCQVETSSTREMGRGKGGGVCRERGNNVGRGGSSRRENIAAIVDFTTR